MTSPEQTAQQRWDSLTKPRGSLGVLEDSIVRLARIQNTSQPTLGRRALYVFCGDHGIAEEGVSLYPSVVTREMVKNFLRGGAAINVLCREQRIDTFIVNAGVSGDSIPGTLDKQIAPGTRNFLHEAAMTRGQADAAIETGRALALEAAQKFDIAATGEMGIANTTSASAILCAFTGLSPEAATGRGTGLDDTAVAHKCEVIRLALARHNVSPRDPVAIASAFGGFEIVMMAGFISGCAQSRLPVVIDGFIGGAAFLIANAMEPACSGNAFFAHRSAERGHRALLEHIGAEPLLDLNMRLGEGTGAALAIGLLTSALHLYNEMATFAEASVSDIPNKEPQSS